MRQLLEILELPGRTRLISTMYRLCTSDHLFGLFSLPGELSVVRIGKRSGPHSLISQYEEAL